MKLGGLYAAGMGIVAIALSTAVIATTPPAKMKTLSTNNIVASSTDQSVKALHKQIQAVADSVPKALAKQQAESRKELADLRAETKAQTSHLQKEVEQLQVQFTKEINAMQKEIKEISARK